MCLMFFWHHYMTVILGSKFRGQGRKTRKIVLEWFALSLSLSLSLSLTHSLTLSEPSVSFCLHALHGRWTGPIASYDLGHVVTRGYRRPHDGVGPYDERQYVTSQRLIISRIYASSCRGALCMARFIACSDDKWPNLIIRQHGPTATWPGTGIMRWLQLRFHFDSTSVRLRSLRPPIQIVQTT